MDLPDFEPEQPELSPNVRHAPDASLSLAEKRLLAQIFDDSRDIFVERKFRSGYSGAVVLLVSPGVDRAQAVVKLAHPTDLQREYQAYRQFVEKSSPQNMARLQGEPLLADNGQLGLLCYSFVGGDPRLPNRSLQAYYDSKGGQATATVLDRIFRVYGRQWWVLNQPHKFTLSEQYDRLLPVHLSLKPTTTAADAEARRLVAGRINAAALAKLKPGQLVRLAGFLVAETRPDQGQVTPHRQPATG